jgi:hypothetical protein
MAFSNAILLFGAAAVVIPLAIHFFHRKTYDEVDWAAMQFLDVGKESKRLRRLDNLVLLLLRCGIIVLLAFALAAPTIPQSTLPRVFSDGPKDLIMLVDNSASMSAVTRERVRDWAGRLIANGRTDDRMAVYAVRRELIPVVPVWSSDSERVKGQLNSIPIGAGTADWPSAVASAAALFDDPSRDRHIVILTDGQRYGLADESAKSRWTLAVPPSENPPRIWIVPIGDSASESPAVAFEPIATSNGLVLANRDMTFRSRISTPVESRPNTVTVEWDGRAAGETPVQSDGSIMAIRRFPPGSHVLTLSKNGERQHLAFQVIPSVPVLIVDGEAKGDANRIHYLQTALSPVKETTSGFTVRRITGDQLGSETLKQNLSGTETPPRIVALMNIAILTAAQSQAIERFLQAGGCVFVTLGEGCVAANWNMLASRGGQGWLPARLDRIVEWPDSKLTPMPAASSHPALASFRDQKSGELHSIPFTKFWKLDPTASPGSSVACSLSSGDPFLVERSVGRGRVILSAVPFDRSWGTSFPTSPDFVRLAHELMFSLAGTRVVEANPQVGSTIAFTPEPLESPAGVTVQTPHAPPLLIPASSWPLRFTDTSMPGVYRFTTASGRTTYFAVQDDPRERDRTPISDSDREALTSAIPGLAFVSTPDEIQAQAQAVAGSIRRTEIGWFVMLGVLLLLVSEVWIVRRSATA